MNLFDVFNALTTYGKIAVLIISGAVFIVIYLMLKIMKDSRKLRVSDKEFTVDTDTSFIRSEETKIKESPKLIDKEFEEEKRKIETFRETPKINGTYVQSVKGKREIKKITKKSKEKVMKFSGVCNFCGRKIGGPIQSKSSRILSVDPERVETSVWVVPETLDLPFICTYCSGTFCQDHRLPEQHNCKGLKTMEKR